MQNVLDACISITRESGGGGIPGPNPLPFKEKCTISKGSTNTYETGHTKRILLVSYLVVFKECHNVLGTKIHHNEILGLQSIGEINLI
jgi:hypothetical protein